LNKNDNREIEISKISDGLKRIGKDYEIATIALSQLSRDIEKREGPPRLSDLRGSGSIEQDADYIGILHVQNREKKSEEITLYLGKNRNGKTGSISLTFSRENMRFSDRNSPEIF
jgi:replicative DNA helicase